MPYTVKSCFDYFNENVVNLDHDQVPIARTSRDTLFGSLHSLSDRGLIPSSYGEMDVSFGSFSRSTKIRPLDDIDLMVCFSGCGGTWKYVEDGSSIAITMPSLVPILSDLRNDDGALNSRKVLEKIKSQLSEVRFYKKAELHRNQEAATLQLTSYDWNFDIVPCFYTTDGFYLIPDGNGNWKKTDPRKDQKRITAINQIKDGKVLQLVRTMKYWKSIWWPSVSSYMLEQMIINLSLLMEFGQPFSQLVCATLNYLSSAILNSVADPKGMQGDLNQLKMEERQRLSQIATRCFSIANDARVQETAYSNQLEAIEKWRNIFGKEFPQYGK